MKRSGGADRQRELDELSLFALTLIDFFASVEGGLGETFARMFREAVQAQHDRRSLAGLRATKNELVGMLQAVPGSALPRLDALLRERTATSVDELLVRQLGAVARIRARGRIMTDEQYYLVREHVEMIWDDARSKEECGQLEAMLQAYEERAARRGKSPEAGGGGSPTSA